MFGMHAAADKGTWGSCQFERRRQHDRHMKGQTESEEAEAGRAGQGRVGQAAVVTTGARVHVPGG